MAQIGKPSRDASVNELLRQTEQFLNTMNEEVRKGKISSDIQERFKTIKDSFRDIPERTISAQIQDLDEDLRNRVLSAIDQLESAQQQHSAKKIPPPSDDIMAFVKEVKFRIRNLKKPAKVERGGKTQLGGGKGGGA